jgi:tetratricopeptide (TPR) repeat protein
MALFGAPVAHEDHGVRACYAALDMQAAILRYAEEVRRTDGLALDIRVGLNSGEVVVRAIGSDLRMDYSAVGQTTHLAARMEQLARPGSTLLTADTLRLAEGYIEVTSLGPVPIKGLDVPVEVYELVGAGPRRSRLHAAATRGLTRFVGRDQEMEQLRQALGRAASGHGQIVAIVGEPGVGKSRLVWEVTHSHRTHGWFIIQAGSVSYGKATPYLPVIDLLQSYFGIQARDETRAIREKVAGKILILDEGLNSIVPAILALLDVPVDDPQWTTLDPRQRRRHTLEAIKRLLLRESQLQPVLVVFEDLHWTDSETQALLDILVDSLPTSRLLLLTNYRPEYEHGWTRKTYYSQVRLDPLTAESADALLRSLVGEDPELESLKALLITRTEGNPFFLEESVRTLIETNVLSGGPGAYRITKAVDQAQVPVTVQAMLAARIDRLPPDDKRLLQSAAVLGKDVPFGLLQAIADLPEDALRQGLARLQAAEFLYETYLFPTLEYTFKHALTLEVTYGSLLQERRRDLHARIVEAIEAQAGDRQAEQVDRLAHHALRGQAWGKALIYLRQAGAKSLARLAHREAVASFEQALVALDHQADSPEKLEHSIDLRFELRTALLPFGEFSRIQGILREAEALAAGAGDQRRLGRAAQFLCVSAYAAGEHAEALAAGARALEAATALGDIGLQAVASGYTGYAYLARTDYGQATACLRRTVSLLTGPLVHERFGQVMLSSVAFRAFLAWSLAEGGEFAEATTIADEAVQIAEGAAHPSSVLIAHLGVGLTAVRQGRVARGISSLERALRICRDLGLVMYIHYVAPPLAVAYTLSGRLAEAVPLLEDAVARDVTMNLMCHHALSLTALGEVYLQAGRAQDARKSAERALQLAREGGEPGHEVHALRLVGEILTQHQSTESAEAHAAYRQALALAEKLGMRPLAAHCHLGLGKLYRRIGKPEPAREHLTTATTMYREMDMRFWREQAEAEIAEGG